MKMHFSTTHAGSLILAGLTAACSGSSVTVTNTVGNGQGGSSSTAVGQQGGTSNVATGTGGASIGGAANGGSAQGGGQSGGASTATGGAATGGASTGGASTGGARTGGASSGGAATGGARTGGASSGGAATGGARTGGASSGGAATGGARTGGASNGGASTGGTSSAGTAKPSTGCSLTTVATGTTIDGTITAGGKQRTYRLSVPTDAAGVSLPLVFGWNGVGGTGKTAQTYFNLETNHHGIFIYPDPYRTDGWDYDDNTADSQFFDALITYLTQNYCIDMNRIFSLGMSAGGIITNRLGCFRGDVLRAIAPSSAMTWTGGACKGDVAVMIICGTQDTYNACNDAKNGAASETAVWLPNNKCGNTTTTSPISNMCQQYSGCTAADPVLLCTHSGGHGWPTSLSDATWNFFMGLP